MNLRKNVVEFLYVVNVKIGDGKYQFRVQAESEETARAKAKKMMDMREWDASRIHILSVERIDPEDFV